MSFCEGIDYDPQPGLDVDSILSNIESDNECLYSPMTIDNEGDGYNIQSSPTTASYPVEDSNRDLRSTSPPDIDFKPLAIRSCRVARSRMTKRDPTPDTSGDESNISVYAPSPKIRPVRYRQVKENSSEERSVSPPLVSIKTEPPSSPSSSSSSTRAVGSPKGKPKPKSKSMQKPKQGGGGGRKGEPRRTQNMIAQKKYRDKRVKAADLMSDTIVELQISSNSASKMPHKRCLSIIQNVMSRYRNKIVELDPNVLAKQDLAVSSGLVKEEK